MGQMGFYDLANRYAGLDAKNEPLVKIDEAVPWEDFRGRLEAVWRRPDKARRAPCRSISPNPLKRLARPGGFEPPTGGLEVSPNRVSTPFR